MGVFAWVQERKSEDVFEISTYKYLGDEAEVSNLADFKKAGMHFISKKKDKNGKGTGIVFRVVKGSNNEDYRRALKALSKIKDKRQLEIINRSR